MRGIAFFIIGFRGGGAAGRSVLVVDRFGRSLG